MRYLGTCRSSSLWSISTRYLMRRRSVFYHQNEWIYDIENRLRKTARFLVEEWRNNATQTFILEKESKAREGLRMQVCMQSNHFQLMFDWFSTHFRLISYWFSTDFLRFSTDFHAGCWKLHPDCKLVSELTLKMTNVWFKMIDFALKWSILY